MTTRVEGGPAPLARSRVAGELRLRRARGLWRDAWYRLTRNRAAVVGLVFVVLLVLVALLASILAPYSFDRQDLESTDLGPSAAHLFGTDQLGRDQLSRLLYGSRISLAVALVDVLIVLVVGVPLGLAAGYFGRWVDTLVMRTVDVLLAFPSLLLVIVVITYLRAVLDQPQGPLLATEAGLSFLGLGVRPPNPSWGILIAEGLRAMRAFPHELIFPAVILAITLICFNFLGDGLRDALDPKLRVD